MREGCSTRQGGKENPPPSVSGALGARKGMRHPQIQPQQLKTGKVVPPTAHLLDNSGVYYVIIVSK